MSKIETFFCDLCKTEQDQALLRKFVVPNFPDRDICPGCITIVQHLKAEILQELSERVDHDLQNIQFVANILRYTNEDQLVKIWGNSGLKAINVFRASYPYQP